MDPRRWLIAPLLVVVVVCGVACQAPTTPTPAPVPSAAALATAPAAPATPTTPPVVGTPAPAPPTPPPSATAPPAPTAPPSATTAAAPPATASRLDTLNAANAAFNGARLKDAAGLYERVVNTPPGSAESDIAARAINDFATFRGLVTLLADGREDEARANLDALRQRDPAAPLTRLADQLYTQYGMVGQLRGACAQLQPQVTAQAGPMLASLQALGVANVDAATLCSVPSAQALRGGDGPWTQA